ADHVVRAGAPAEPLSPLCVEPSPSHADPFPSAPRLGPRNDMLREIRRNPEPAVENAPSAGSSVDSLAAAMQSGSIVSQIESQIENFRRLCNETTKRTAELESRESEVRRLSDEYARKDAELQARIESFGKEAAEATAREREELALNQRDLDEKRIQAERLRADVEGKEAELRSREEAIAAAQASANRAAEDASGKLAEAQTQNDKAERLAAEALRRVQNLESELTNAMAALAQAFHDREVMETQRTDLQRAIDAGARDRERCAALELQVQGLNTRLDAAGQPGEPGVDPTGPLRDQLASTAAELAQREQMLDVLSKRMLNSEETALANQAAITDHKSALADAHAQIAELRSAPGGEIDQGARRRDELRRARLDRYKRLLAGQSDKLVRAKSALRKRMDECEQVLSQRQRLSEAAASIERQQQILSAKLARNSAVSWIAYAAATVVLVGVIAWHVAGQVAPATYAANAAIAPDGRGREVTGDEIAAWSESLQQLTKDPQVLSAAAENYSRRGMTSLSNVAAVKQKLDADLYIKPDPAGALRFELRTQGRERAARELETYLSALLTEADRQKDLRADGLASSLTLAPTATAEPLESQRMLYAAGLTGGGMIACLGLGGIIYRLLLRSRLKFELEQQALEAA
ncbi:MAG: hypothetical protein ACT4PL_03975, partial [Phycisphaerales bacterium]